MKRYFSSFFIATFVYAMVGVGLYYGFVNEKIIMKEPSKPKTISLNHIELKPQPVKPVIEKVKELKEPVVEEKIKEEIVKPIKKKLEPKIVEKPKPKPKKIEKKKLVKKEIKKTPKKEVKKEIKKVVQEVVPTPTSKNISTVEKPVEPKVQTQQKVVTHKIDEKKEYLSKHLSQIRNLINQNVKYPTRARKLSIQGIVTVKFKINSNGTVENITILDGHKFLQKATIKAIQNASKYFPKVTKSIEIQIPIEYKLI
jgi:periplasmic protein TonB